MSLPAVKVTVTPEVLKAHPDGAERVRVTLVPSRKAPLSEPGSVRMMFVRGVHCGVVELLARSADRSVPPVAGVRLMAALALVNIRSIIERASTATAGLEIGYAVLFFIFFSFLE
jgi:hypothetical protein